MAAAAPIKFSGSCSATTLLQAPKHHRSAVTQLEVAPYAHMRLHIAIMTICSDMHHG